MTATFQPRASARNMTPNAADDLPLPSPVLTRNSDLTCRTLLVSGLSVGAELIGVLSVATKNLLTTRASRVWFACVDSGDRTHRCNNLSYTDSPLRDSAGFTGLPRSAIRLAERNATYHQRPTMVWVVSIGQRSGSVYCNQRQMSRDDLHVANTSNNTEHGSHHVVSTGCDGHAYSPSPNPAIISPS